MRAPGDARKRILLLFFLGIGVPSVLLGYLAFRIAFAGAKLAFIERARPPGIRGGIMTSTPWFYLCFHYLALFSIFSRCRKIVRGSTPRSRAVLVRLPLFLARTSAM